MDEPITKRLHIAGLTTAISAEDIQKRLSTFGTVKSVDGVGLLDGIGQPRKFGYVTIETTAGKLSRCMNVLSGSTWKGTKLRLGEAKPDFAERIAKEIAEQPKERPRKRQRTVGVYAQDMSIVGPDNVDARAGWKKTPLGRIIKPIRMRPEHPLPPTLEEEAQLKTIAKKKATATRGKKEKRVKPKAPPTRSRTRTIDPIKWGSTHLKGIFLESQGPAPLQSTPLKEDLPVSEDDDTSSEEEQVEEEEEEEEEEEKEEEEVNDEAEDFLPAEPIRADSPLFESVAQPDIPPQTKVVPTLPTPKTAPVSQGIDLASEKKATLNILASLFGDNDDWDGRESVGSDIDEEEILKNNRAAKGTNVGNDFEIVPREPVASLPQPDSDESDDASEDEDEAKEDASEGRDVEMDAEKEASPSPAPAPQKSGLSDLFAPRNENAGFSLLGHLDLDLEMDDDILGITQVESIALPVPHYTPAFQSSVSATPPTTHNVTYINPKQPLFFPLPRSDDSMKARQRDIFDVIKENKWDWRDPSVKWYRTASEDEIRKEWEEKKGDLTRDWKKRAREAGKMNRKRKGVDGDGDV